MNAKKHSRRPFTHSQVFIMRTSSVSPALSPLLRRSLALTLLLTGAHCSGYECRHRPDTDVADPAIDRESDSPDGGGSDAGALVDLYQACNGYSDRCLELNSN